MDALSEVLQDFRLSGVSYGRCELRNPWGVSFAAQPLLRLHFVAEGEAWLCSEATGPMQLRAGDVVLLPQGIAHRLASGPDVACHPIDKGAITHHGGNVCSLVQAGDGAGATLFCGSMALEAHALHPLIALMPAVIKGCDVIGRDPMLGPLLEAMRAEAAEAQVGGATMLSRMADLLAARVIRNWVHTCQQGASGWLAAIRDPQVGRALAAIHRDPGQNWTVESLARVAGQSRSIFAERFSTLMGEGAAHYVARWRMQVAQEWLRRRDLTVAAVASRLGYESEASFGRAFKRVTGKPPGEVRREDTSGRTDMIFGQ